MVIGRWSACGGCKLGSISQIVIGLTELSLLQTLSGCMQLEVAVSYICIPRGNVICMLCLVMRSRSGFIISAELKRVLFSSVSHKGWC